MNCKKLEKRVEKRVVQALQNGTNSGIVFITGVAAGDRSDR